ncbi:DUF167 domain-containing protein [Geminocystis sp. GBBB08]|uniref:DUF167 domain-containing protein n=1 Tax=Geminocystis sp. GBBB08 TaxID=2604140 RepID=UPI0027E30033|nr:DUF167 domain-containing protein [Geminocystis sp. GBBB08]MBL1208304.1 DUF167 domain-containing protein [Geminocystis sp. GBBB08]
MKINVKVKPKSKQQKIEKNPEGIRIIHLKSAPIDGKANQELREIIAQKFKIKKAQITIKHGLSSHNKVIQIDD